MPTLVQTEVFSGSPVLLVLVEEVTVVAKLLPAFFTG